VRTTNLSRWPKRVNRQDSRSRPLAASTHKKKMAGIKHIKILWVATFPTVQGSKMIAKRNQEKIYNCLGTPF
jgi:hypothetical protein